MSFGTANNLQHGVIIAILVVTTFISSTVAIVLVIKCMRKSKVTESTPESTTDAVYDEISGNVAYQLGSSTVDTEKNLAYEQTDTLARCH